jgi:hypothetical protein
MQTRHDGGVDKRPGRLSLAVSVSRRLVATTGGGGVDDQTRQLVQRSISVSADLRWFRFFRACSNACVAASWFRRHTSTRTTLV